MTGLFTASLNRRLLVTTTSADARLVFEVVTEEGAEFQVVISLDQREVVFPDIEIFAIGPRSLVPDVGVSTRTPEQRRNRAADVAVRASGRLSESSTAISSSSA